MKQLIEIIARSLVDQPDKVTVNEVQGYQCTVLELNVEKSDIGKIIGKQGRTAQAIRTILSAASAKIKKKSLLEILESDEIDSSGHHERSAVFTSSDRESYPHHGRRIEVHKRGSDR